MQRARFSFSEVSRSQHNQPRCSELEDRKQALLHKLEQQDQEDMDSVEQVLDMKQILEETSLQIQLREKEIADLKSLLEQQSVATNGLAVVLLPLRIWSMRMRSSLKNVRG